MMRPAETSASDQLLPRPVPRAAGSTHGRWKKGASLLLITVLGLIPPAVVLSVSSLTEPHAHAQTAAGSAVAAFDDTADPADVKDLLRLERKISAVVAKAVPATVGVRVGHGQGSGVIVSQDGFVLTAAHVIGEANVPATIILEDGTELPAVTLGLNRSDDAGMLKITAPGPHPYAEMGDSATVGTGKWVVATGHPGGYREGRPPVVRVGRININAEDYLRSDSTLVGGDSGGPLFDLEGRVIGIHSRIGNDIADNVHVPVDTYKRDWQRLLAGEMWGGFNVFEHAGERAWMGVVIDRSDVTGSDGVRLASVIPGGPAEQAGLQAGDVITALDEKPIGDFRDLQLRMIRYKPGDELRIRILREGEPQDIELTLVSADDLNQN